MSRAIQQTVRSSGRAHRAAACSYDLARLRRDLRPMRLHWAPRLRSTSDHAAALRHRGELFAPAVVLTAHQVAGRGRGGNAWWSDRGALTATFAFAVDPQLAPHQIPLIAGLAVRDAAAEMSGVSGIQLKWPNDLLFEGRKLAGLLCERVHRVDLIGVGMNANIDPAAAPAGLRRRITSLLQMTGRMTDMSDAVLAIARHLRLRLGHRDEQSFVESLREYDGHHALVGEQVSIAAEGGRAVAGRCEGLDSEGRLLVRDAGQLHRIISGEVRWRRP